MFCAIYSSIYKFLKLRGPCISNKLKMGVCYQKLTERYPSTLKGLRLVYEMCVVCDNLDPRHKFLLLSAPYFGAMGPRLKNPTVSLVKLCHIVPAQRSGKGTEMAWYRNVFSLV